MGTFALSMVVAIVIPFILTTIVGKRRGLDKAPQAAVEADVAEETPAMQESMPEGKMETELRAYLDGEVIALADVGDGVFSAGMVGDGLAIRPTTDVLCAPADAKVTVLMEESRHAIGLTLPDGTELLLHVGLDTVAMGGEGFSYLVHQGEFVKAGQPLLKFDRQKIKAAGHPDVTICVVTNPADHPAFAFKSGQMAETGKTIIAERTAL